MTRCEPRAVLYRLKVYRQYTPGLEICDPIRILNRPLSTSVTEEDTRAHRSTSPLAGLSLNSTFRSRHLNANAFVPKNSSSMLKKGEEEVLGLRVVNS